jgi:hypothetical protein
MALFGVIGAICTDLLYLASQLIEQGRQDFIIPYSFKANFGGNDGMGLRIDRQVKLAPDSPFLLAVLVHLPLSFAVDLQPGGINHQMSHWPLTGQAVLNVDLFGTFADAAVVR